MSTSNSQTPIPGGQAGENPIESLKKKILEKILEEKSLFIYYGQLQTEEDEDAVMDDFIVIDSQYDMENAIVTHPVVLKIFNNEIIKFINTLSNALADEEEDSNVDSLIKMLTKYVEFVTSNCTEEAEIYKKILNEAKKYFRVEKRQEIIENAYGTWYNNYYDVYNDNNEKIATIAEETDACSRCIVDKLIEFPPSTLCTKYSIQ